MPVHSVQQQKPYTATVCNGTVQLKLKFRPNPSSAKACLVPRIDFFSYVLKANVANTLLFQFSITQTAASRNPKAVLTFKRWEVQHGLTLHLLDLRRRKNSE